jgi:hypothetical protein
LQNAPREHHYVPRFYLAGFTKSGRKDGLLYVLDKRKRKSWGPVTPSYVAKATDFYKIDGPQDTDPATIETALSEIESQCAPVIFNIVQQKQLPSGAEFDIFLNFVALMASRVPAIRGAISAGVDELLKHVVRTMLSTEEGQRRFAQACTAGGGQADMSDDELKAMKTFADSDEYSVNMDQNWHIGMMLQLGARLVPALAERKWSIWIANDNAPDLICSDRPACLTWCIPEPGPLPPAFLLPNTAVIMPINRRVVVSGRLEEQPPRSFLDKHDVAIVNRSVLEYACQVYSSEAEFEWAMTDELIGNATGLLDMLGQIGCKQ